MRLAFLAALMAIACQPAIAATCAPHDEVARQLADRYGETRRAMGITATGLLFELYVSEAGTWTAVLTQPNGPTCLGTSGDQFQELAEKLPPNG